MKIALINENSQAPKNALIFETLKKVAEPLGHECFNYGRYSAEDPVEKSYVQEGLLAGILLDSGAALDCMRGEPISPDNKLFRHENMLVSPHMGWYSVQAAIDLKRKVAEQAVKFAQTGTVDYPVYKN